MRGGDLQVGWTSPHVLRVSAAMVWYLVGWGVLGLAAGWVTRSKLGGAALLMTVMLVLAPVLGLIPGRVGEVVVALMPSSAGAAMVSTHPATAEIAGVSVNVPVYRVRALDPLPRRVHRHRCVRRLPPRCLTREPTGCRGGSRAGT